MTATYRRWRRQRDQQHSCDGKVIYSAPRRAMRAAVRSAYDYGQPLTEWGYYRCRIGPHWHTGHKGAGAS